MALDAPERVSGHFLAEEAPEETAAEILKSLAAADVAMSEG